jgi:RimJ/RimL family protein N-acetyltransferase
VVPILETARLRLRPVRPDDLDGHARMLADPDFVRFLGGTPHSREDSWRRMLMMSGLWPMLGYGYWSVEAKADGCYLGVVGFADFKRELTPSIEGLPEMGWLMTPSVQGQGVATEAVLGALAWADEALAGREVVAIVDHRNAPSIRVAEKAGFAVREEAVYRDEPILLFRRTPGGELSPIS